MIRHCLSISCVLVAIAWASLGVAQWPPGEADHAATEAAPASSVGSVALVGVSVLTGVAAVGFRRDGRWREQT